MVLYAAGTGVTAVLYALQRFSSCEEYTNITRFHYVI